MKLKKKLFCVCIFAFVATLCIALSACDSHEDTFSSQWMYDETSHWQKPNDTGPSVGFREEHTFVNGMCEVCGYQQSHEHIFSDDWTTDGAYHWHAAICEHKSVVSNKAEHVIVNDTCYICGFMPHNHTYSQEWSYDESGHYHASTCGHGVEKDRENHTFYGTTCSICGYTLNYTPGLTFRQVNFGTGLSYELTGIGTASGGTIIVPETYNGYPVISIASTAFANCIAVKEIVIPDSVINIPNGVFSGCTSLERLTVPFVNGMAGAMFGGASYTCTDYNQLLPVKTKECSWKVNGQTVYGMRPVDGTDWTLDATWITVNGKKMLYQQEVVSASTWTTFNLYISGVKVDSWDIPLRANCTVYGVPQTLELLTVTNQLISRNDAVFKNLPCSVEIVKKYEIQSLEVNGPSSVYIDEFDYSNYTLRVMRVNGDVETYRLSSDYFSVSDNAKFQTLGKHTVTANFENTAVSFDIEIKEHSFDEAIFASQSFFYDGTTKYLEVIGIPDGTDVTYTNNGQTEIGEYTVTVTLTKEYYKSVTLTATLTVLNSDFTITYVLGKEGAINENPTHYNYYDETIVLQNAEYPYYEFLGWYLDGKIITAIEQGSSGDIVLYAKWQSIFTVSGNTITGLTTYGKENYPSELVIPSQIDGVSITAIGDNAFIDCVKLISVDIPTSIVSIGSYAFYRSENLTTVYWNAIQCTKAGYPYYSFRGCTNLTAIIIGKQVQSMPACAFSECSNLSVYIADLVAWCNIDFAASSANPLRDGGRLYLEGQLVADLVIPSEVTTIKSYAFYGCSSIIGITIPESITSIKDSAFYGCSNLNAVYIADLAAWCKISFGNGSANPLYYANNLYLDGQLVTEMQIPSAVTAIKSYAFYGYSALQTVTYYSDSKLASINSYAFYGCRGLTSVSIPQGVTSINSYAFSGCSQLTALMFEDDSKLITIGYSAFEKCTSLSSIIIPQSATTIGGSAFYGCSSLTSVSISKSVTTIGSSAFYGCQNLASVYITDLVAWCNIEFSGATANPLYYADDLYLNGRRIIDLEIPSEVTTIKGYIFSGYISLQSVTFNGNSNLTTINSYAFYGCSNLASITFIGGVATVYNDAFYNCSKLTAVYITDLVAWCNIDFSGATANPLYYAHNLCLDGQLVTELETPLEVTTIKNYAFYGCRSLTKVTISDSVTSIGVYTFRGCTNLQSISIPFVGATKDGTSNVLFGYLFGASSTANNSDNIPNALKEVIITGGTIIGENAFYNCRTLTRITILKDVTTIGYRAFSYCTGLTNMIISQCVTSIGDFAFYCCSGLTNITIPQSVTSIGDAAFCDCNNLKTITIPFVGATKDGVRDDYFGYIFGSDSSYNNPYSIPNSLKEVIVTGGTIISSYAFYYCDELRSITIPEGVITIGGRAFSNCTGLTSIIIPQSITSIGSFAFYECSNLETVYYGGTKEQWNTMEIDTTGGYNIANANAYLTSATRYYLSEEEPTLNEDGTGYDGNYWHWVDGMPTIWKKEN